MESGLMNFWFNQYVSNVNKCMIKNNRAAEVNKKKMRSLKPIDLSGIFVLLAIGYLFSILVVLC